MCVCVCVFIILRKYYFMNIYSTEFYVCILYIRLRRFLFKAFVIYIINK